MSRPNKGGLGLDLFKILEFTSKNTAWLRAKVEQDREALEDLGLEEKTITLRLTKRYIDAAVFRSTTVNAASALPLSLPLVGIVPTFVGTLGYSLYYTYRNEIELCYLLAYLNQTALSDDKLRWAIFWLIQLTDFNSVKKQAKQVGIQLTLSSFVKKLVVLSASRGLGHACTSLSQGGTPYLFGIADRRLTFAASFLIGTPMAGYLGYRSTRSTAKRAIDFFTVQPKRS